MSFRVLFPRTSFVDRCWLWRISLVNDRCHEARTQLLLTRRIQGVAGRACLTALGPLGVRVGRVGVIAAIFGHRRWGRICLGLVAQRREGQLTSRIRGRHLGGLGLGTGPGRGFGLTLLLLRLLALALFLLLASLPFLPDLLKLCAAKVRI
jgi:hypothetical protein